MIFSNLYREIYVLLLGFLQRFSTMARYALGFLFLICWSPALASERISIVGSSTVFPFSSAVAEEFGRASGYPTPVVESTGTGGGFKLFCKSDALDTPSVSNASRRIKSSEYNNCSASNISVLEVPVGYDGIVVAQSRGGLQFDVSLRDLFLALADKVPNRQGVLIDNPYRTWRDVNPNLPHTRIIAYGPPPTSGTRDAFVELAMEAGAKTFKSLANLRKKDKKAFQKVAHAMREDGLFIEAGENDNLIVQKLRSARGAVGIFGYSFLEQNLSSLRGLKINNVAPEFDNILRGDYSLARLLYFYVKREHFGRVDGLREFVEEFVDESATGEEGYLTDVGLIPLPEDMREELLESVNNNVAYRP